MGKFKECPKYNVISIRVSDEEKAYLDELTKRDRTTISNLMREAMHRLYPIYDVAAEAALSQGADGQ